MRSSERKNGREVRLAVLVLILTLLLGAGIQAGLRLRDTRRETRAGEEIASALLTGIRLESEAARERREAAALRMAGLPEQKQARLAALELDLLTVVNPWNPLPEGWEPELETVVGDYQLDARCASACWRMMQDCRSTGTCWPMICSAWRSQDYQQQLFDNKVLRVQIENWWASYEEAEELAAREVAYPGTSEHQLGLAADIIDETFPYLTEWQETTPTQSWLMEHCADYGFILRYPEGTSDITGIIYEPWHYRYVGVKFAKEITNRGITLEEYVAWRRGR